MEKGEWSGLLSIVDVSGCLSNIHFKQLIRFHPLIRFISIIA